MPKQNLHKAWFPALCATQAGVVLVFMNFAGALPLIQQDWGLSNAQAGAIQTARQIGYALAVLVLSSLTDYVGGERLILGGALWAGISNLALALFAQNANHAIFFRALTGAGIAGIYMPGVRIVAERASASQRGRSIGLFVAAFTLGSAASIAFSGRLASTLGWRHALALTSLGPLAGALLSWRTLLLPLSQSPASPAPRRAESRPVPKLIHNRPALLTIAAYTFHTWEVLGLRGWLPAFLTAVLLRSGAGLNEATHNGATMAGIAVLLGAVSNASTAALSDRLGRTRTIMIAMTASLICILGLGLTLNTPYALAAGVGLMAALLANADSAVISTTLTETVPPETLGRTLAVFSFSGFTAGAIAPLAFGAVFDYTDKIGLLGDSLHLTPWSGSFAILALGSLAGLVATVALHRQLRRRGVSELRR